MGDFCIMKSVHCSDQVCNQLIELPNGPVPDMLSLELDDLAEGSVDPLHYQYMAAGFRQDVHACTYDVTVDELMQVL
jgi:hypothetical protein